MDADSPPAAQIKIHRLWDELADFPASRTGEALVHLMETLCGWLRADNALWIGGVRVAAGTVGRQDPQHGWRGRVLSPLYPHTSPQEQLSRRAMREQDTDPGMTTRTITAQAGEFRVHRLRDGFVDFARFRRTAHYKTFYQEAGLTDRIWVVMPVNEDAESYFLFDLYHTRRRFSSVDAELAGHALRGLKWFHRHLMLSHGLLVADTRLTPSQRRVLALLLTAAKEADIAATLKLSPGTVHQYAVELYRKLGVRGRAGLLSLWLGH